MTILNESLIWSWCYNLSFPNQGCEEFRFRERAMCFVSGFQSLFGSKNYGDLWIPQWTTKNGGTNEGDFLPIKAVGRNWEYSATHAFHSRTWWLRGSFWLSITKAICKQSWHFGFSIVNIRDILTVKSSISKCLATSQPCFEKLESAMVTQQSSPDAEIC